MPTDTSENGLESLIVTDMLASGWQSGTMAYDRITWLDIDHLRASGM